MHSKILSLSVCKSNLESVTQRFSQIIINNEKERFNVTPVNSILCAFKKPLLKKYYEYGACNLADGVPVVWASKYLGDPIEGRVTGLDLLPKFAEVADQKGYSFFFLGAKEGVAAQLAVTLKAKYKNLEVLGYYSPPFADRFSDEENEKMIAMINEVRPNVLWVSLTAPKQDIWIYDHFDRLDVNIAIGVGGAFEVTAGLIKRAPIWMQKMGLEWLFRFLQEPRRMFRRYFIEAPQFVPLIIMQKYGILNWFKKRFMHTD